ncbi:MAG: DNA polymerase III subunit gamma/tau [Chloroflexi bacterium]|nr:DNA polymerase III subunit gamma/tau [Chloroflexota bacterium]
MTQAFYRKWRPRKWDEVVGQQHIIQTLRNALVGGRVGHAYLFAGPRGTGKTTVARLLAKAVNCQAEDAAARPCNECEHCVAVNENRFLDLIEIDAASNNGVDDVRDLREKINFSPSQGQFKIYIIDEVHMLSTPAFNALLKTLEEPPPHAIFILATTEIHKIPATVLSRCQRHEFRRVPVDDIVAQLKHIAKSEKLSVEPAALTLIARQATGSLRDAISLLDQLASTGGKITLDLTQTVLGTATSQTVLDLVDAIRDVQPASGLEALHRALDAGSDPRALARQIVDYLRALMLFQMGNDKQVDAAQNTKKRMRKHAKDFSASDVLRMMRAFNAAAVDQRGGWQPSLSLELALAEVLDVLGTSEPDVVSAPRSAPSQAPAPKREPVLYQTSGPASVKQTESKPKPALAQSPGQSEGAAEAPEAVAATPKGSPQVISTGEVSQAWKDIQSRVKKTAPNLAALLNSCKSINVQGNTLVLGFVSGVLVEKMEKPDQIEITRQAIADLLGVELTIRCVVTNAKGKVPPDIDQNGMVAAALQAGGEIVDIQE